MFIEDEADAVFNEIRSQRKEDADNEEEAGGTKDLTRAAATETKAVSPAPPITIKVDGLDRAEDQKDNKGPEEDGAEAEDVELEEPVSPPACDPSEGPPLLFSQSIEVRKDSQHNQPVLTSLSVSGLGSRHREGEKTG